MRSARLLTVAALTASLAFTTGCGLSDPPPVSAKVQEAYDKGKVLVMPTQTPRTTMVSVVEKLAAGEPWTMTVLGDSTGNEAGEWVQIVGQHIGAKYDRPVTVYTWDEAANKYDGGTLLAQGSGADVKIWNGSAPGKSADFALANLPLLAPEAFDLLVINHGHNHLTPSAAVQSIKTLIVSADLIGGPKATAVTIQNPWGVPTESSVGVQDAIRAAFTAPEFTPIDVMTAFKSDQSGEPLLKDNIHPSAKGGEIWAATAQAALGL